MLLQAAEAEAAAQEAATAPVDPRTKQRQARLVQQLRDAASAAAAGPPPPLPGLVSDFLYRRWYRCHTQLCHFLPAADAVPRVTHGTLDRALFAARYDAPAQPVILTGFMAAEWPPGWQQHWQLQQLVQQHGQQQFWVSRPSGGKAKMTLAAYADYMLSQRDEEPLYVFDEGFGEAAPQLLQAYCAPSVIGPDFSSLLSESAVRVCQHSAVPVPRC